METFDEPLREKIHTMTGNVLPFLDQLSTHKDPEVILALLTLLHQFMGTKELLEAL